MKKTLLYSVIALALVLGLILPMAVPVVAEVIGSKVRDPDEAPYKVGDTIYYTMVVENPESVAVNNLTKIWDELPDGEIHWFVQEGDPPLVLGPGQNHTYYLQYVVDWHDREWIEPPAGEPYWGVRNRFYAQGTDSLARNLGLDVEDIAEVIPLEPVGGEAFPVSKLSILVPWIALGAAIIAGAGIFVRRRRARS